MILCGTVERMFSFFLLSKTQISPIIFKLIVLYCCPRTRGKNLFVCSFCFFSIIEWSRRRLMRQMVRYFPSQIRKGHFRLHPGDTVFSWLRLQLCDLSVLPLHIRSVPYPFSALLRGSSLSESRPPSTESWTHEQRARAPERVCVGRWWNHYLFVCLFFKRLFFLESFLQISELPENRDFCCTKGWAPSDPYLGSLRSYQTLHRVRRTMTRASFIPFSGPEKSYTFASVLLSPSWEVNG